MASRTIYSCDWCRVDSPSPGHVGAGWGQRTMRHQQDVWLCGSCDAEYWRHVDVARMLCVQRSSPSSSKDGGT